MNTVREFKFACPVCHQHIQCEAASSGRVIACPTCFQQIIVPQSPTGHTTKLILRGTQAAARKPAAAAAPRRPASPRLAFGLAGVVSAVLLALLAFFLKH